MANGVSGGVTVMAMARYENMQMLWCSFGFFVAPNDPPKLMITNTTDITGYFQNRFLWSCDKKKKKDESTWTE